MESIGQLIITGLNGTALTQEESEFIENEKIGGVVLFSHNYENPAQLAELVNSIQKLRDEYPLFISVDHEGGKVTRFKTHFSQFPPMLEIAKQDSPKLVFEVHQVMASELSACGINLVFSPVCDILTNEENKVIADRAFGRDPETVEKFISAAIRGLQTSGLLSCAKHFPGHGDTTKDSHFDLPLIKNSLELLRSRELIPFIKASKSRVEFMMMGHLQVDELDQKYPATLSPSAYAFLREETKFSKIIITDDMEMKAITDRFSLEEASVLALNAGTDMLLFKTSDAAIKALAAIKEAVKKKILKKEMLIDKLQRIEKCKRDHFKDYKPLYIPQIAESFNSAESKKVLDSIKRLS